MANKAVEFVIRGSIDWCKLLGPARPYTGDPKFDKGPNWSVEINPDAKSRALLAKYGLDEKLKKDKLKKKDGTPAKNPRSYDFIRLTILENRPDGEKNKAPKIKDASGRLWDNETEMGNGTMADILVRYVDYVTTKGLYYKEMMVLRLVPYEGGEGLKPLSEDDEFFGGGLEPVSADATESKAFEADLDDDVPF